MPVLKGFQDGAAVIGFPNAKRYEVLAGGEGYIAHPNPHEKLFDQAGLQAMAETAQKPEARDFYAGALASLNKLMEFQANGASLAQVAAPMAEVSNKSIFRIKGNDFSA
ncbi:MAG: hypothetical protein WC043_01030 [Pseudobdellovibrionaceae bacterium]